MQTLFLSLLTELFSRFSLQRRISLNIADKWIEKVFELSSEEELYIPVVSRTEQKRLIKDLYSSKKGYSKIDPEGASRIIISPTFHKGKIWVKLRISSSAGPTVGFKRKEDGSFEEISISSNIERTIFLMKKDGLSEKEIIETLSLGKKDIETLKQKGVL
jgi:hypothetical protein